MALTGAGMTAKELFDILSRNEKYFVDTDVKIVLSLPSVGPVATTDVVGARFGFDWNSGSFLIYPKDRLVPKENKQDIFEAAYELLMFLATEALTKKNHNYEQKRAIRILTRYGITADQIKSYVKLFHRDKPIISNIKDDEIWF